MVVWLCEVVLCVGFVLYWVLCLIDVNVIVGVFGDVWYGVDVLCLVGVMYVIYCVGYVLLVDGVYLWVDIVDVVYFVECFVCVLCL